MLGGPLSVSTILGAQNSDDTLRFFVVLLILVLVSLMSSIWPLLLSLRQPTSQETQALSVQKTRHLKGIMESPEGYNAFLSWSQEQFAGEAPLFWKEARDFRQKHVPASNDSGRGPSVAHLDNDVRAWSPDTELKISASPAVSEPQPGSPLTFSQVAAAAFQAQRLFDRFLAPGAPFFVSVSADITAEVVDTLRRCNDQLHQTAKSPVGESMLVQAHLVPLSDATLRNIVTRIGSAFDSARNEVLQAMEANSFGRFRRSPAFAALVAHLNLSADDIAFSASDNDVALMSQRLSTAHTCVVQFQEEYSAVSVQPLEVEVRFVLEDAFDLRLGPTHRFRGAAAIRVQTPRNSLTLSNWLFLSRASNSYVASHALVVPC